MKSFCFIFGVFALCKLGLANEIDDLRETTKVLQQEVQALSFHLKELKSNEEAAEKRIATLEEENANFKARTLADDNKIQKLEKVLSASLDEKQITSRTRMHSTDSVFLATVSVYTLPIGTYEQIIFDTAPINPGGNYDTETGGYTAPVNGYYQFSKRGSDFSGTFVFTVDDDAYAAMLTFSDNDSAPSASATINLELSAGQVVQVENVDSTIIYGTEFGLVYTWFSGHLLYPL